jgi:hypothetical protein
VELHIQYDWLPAVGETVEIRRAGRTIRAGTVDAVAADGSLLWLATEGLHLRALFERSEGYEVWIPHKWEQLDGT